MARYMIASNDDIDRIEYYTLSIVSVFFSCNKN